MTDCPSAPAVRNPLSIILALMVSCVIAACGGPGGPDGVPADDAFGGNGDGTAGDGFGGDGAGSGAVGNGSASGGSADGPITVTMPDRTVSYVLGRCEIINDVVHLDAMAENQRGQIQVTLPEWDRPAPYGHREGGVSLTGYDADANESFSLVASRNDPETTWDWTVSGTDVQVTARMGNRATATREDGVERFTEVLDVTIDIECSNGPFGSGPFASQYAEQEFFPMEDPMQRVPGSVSVDLDGSTYEITYLTYCTFFQDQVTAEGYANEANVYLYSEGRGVHLGLVVGDRREEARGGPVGRWSLPPGAELQDDFMFEGGDTSRTWSGTVISEDGGEADATITVECTEGDSFESAGGGSIVLDGVIHAFDVVNACSIDGTTVDFFGTASDTDVTVIVTAGGSEILFGDEDGRQSLTRGVELEVAGQQATWSGVLPGDRQATLEISCG